MRSGVVFVLVLLVLWGGLASAGGCERAAPAARGTTPAPEVRTVAAWTGTVDLVVRAVGQVRAVESVSLASEVAGLVAAVNFDESTMVEEGQILVQLDDRRARADLQAVQATRDLASRQLERFQQAASISAASAVELDTVRTELTRAEAQLQLARIRVEDHAVRAPFAGRVGLRQVSPGAHVDAGDALTTLSTVDPIEFEFSVPEVYLAGLEPGLELTVTSPAFAGREFAAQVSVVSPQVDPSTRTVLVLARAANPDGVLRPGMFADVRLVVGQRRDAVLIPEAAIEFQGSQAWAYAVKDERAQRRPLRLGERRAGLAEVVEGIAAGEPVVVEGLQRIRDGAAVRAVEASERYSAGRTMSREEQVAITQSPAAPVDGERN